MFDKLKTRRPLSFILILLCAATAAPAQTPPINCRVYCPDGTSHAVLCNTNIDLCSSTAGPGPAPVSAFQLSAARFEAVLARLDAYRGFKVSPQPSPGTIEELSQQADELFVSTALRLDRLSFNSDGLATQTKGLESYLQTLYADERQLKATAAILPAELRAASELLSVELARAEAQERIITSVEAVADRMHERADRAAEEAMQWLTVASPREVLLVSAGTVSGRKTSARQPMSVPTEPVYPRPTTPAVPIRPTYPPGLRRAPSGTADDKISAIEGLIPQIDAVSALEAERAKLFLKVKIQVDNVTSRIDALKIPVNRGKSSLSAVEALTYKAKSRQSEAYWNGLRAGGNAALAIMEAYVLEKFRDEVVIPEVKRFLRANGVMKKIDGSLVVELYRMGKSALPTGKRWEMLNRLIEVEKRALTVLNDFETYTLAAAASLSSPTDTNGFKLAREIDTLTNDAGRELVERAAGDTGPIYKIIRAIFDSPR